MVVIVVVVVVVVVVIVVVVVVVVIVVVVVVVVLVVEELSVVSWVGRPEVVSSNLSEEESLGWVGLGAMDRR